jgi:predicted anti-sigma-YlaC factor YlaD
MNTERCAAMSDQMPDWLNDRLNEVDRARVEEHVAQCPACRQEREVLRGVRRTRPAIPAALEARVVAAVRSRPARHRWVPGQLAAAASVVLAIATGGVLVLSSGPAASGDPVQQADPTASAHAGHIGDPLLHGGPGLSNLSVDELQALLAELDS